MSEKHLTVVTHNGTFHADEVFACAAIRAFSGREAVIHRTRNLEEIEDLAWGAGRGNYIVLDVGGKLDPRASRYDHHQRTYEGTQSSFGLLWEHEAVHWVSDEVHAFIQRELVEFVDARDTGRQPFELCAPAASPLFIDRIISGFNGVLHDEEAEFERAVRLATDILRSLQLAAQAQDLGTSCSSEPNRDAINNIIEIGLSGHEMDDGPVLDRVLQVMEGTALESEGRIGWVRQDCKCPTLLDVVCWLPIHSTIYWLNQIIKNIKFGAAQWVQGYEEIQRAFDERPQDYMMVLPQFTFWKEHLEAIDPHHRVQRVVHPGKGGGWQVACRSNTPQSFDMKYPHPVAWRGLNGEELRAVIDNEDIPTPVFCHKAGFLAGVTHFEEALALACQSMAVAQIEAVLVEKSA